MSVIKFPSRKLNKKKMVIFISICSVAFILLILSIIYAFSSSFRAFIDIYIFRKKIKSDNLATIEISSDEDHYFHAYDKYILFPLFSAITKNLFLLANNGDVIFISLVAIFSPELL